MSKNINTFFPTESINEVKSKATLKEPRESRKLFIEKKSSCSSLIYSVKYDGKVNNNNYEKKADYLVINNQVDSNSKEVTIEIYICELKGQDINGAYEQILATYNQLKPNVQLSVGFKAIVVATKVPPGISKAKPNKITKEFTKAGIEKPKHGSREYKLVFE